MKISLVGSESFHAEGRTDMQAGRLAGRHDEVSGRIS